MLFLRTLLWHCIITDSKPYKILTIFLLKFTKVEFDKSLIRLWLNFGKNLVPWNQGVMRYRKIGEKMINLTFQKRCIKAFVSTSKTGPKIEKTFVQKLCVEFTIEVLRKDVEKKSSTGCCSHQKRMLKQLFVFLFSRFQKKMYFCTLFKN